MIYCLSKKVDYCLSYGIPYFDDFGGRFYGSYVEPGTFLFARILKGRDILKELSNGEGLGTYKALSGTARSKDGLHLWE